VVSLFWPVFDLLTAGSAFALGVTDRPIDVVTHPFSETLAN
jgi:hypothetical protein